MIITNNTLKKLLEEKDELVTQGRALTVEIEKLEKERAKIGLQIQKKKDKVIPIVEKMKNSGDIPLEEYDEIESVSIVKGEVEVKLFNHMEEFKKAYAEKVAKEKDSQNK